MTSQYHHYGAIKMAPIIAQPVVTVEATGQKGNSLPRTTKRHRLMDKGNQYGNKIEWKG